MYNKKLYVVVHVRGVEPGLGQVASPGGSGDQQDGNSRNAAIREWNEETGGIDNVTKHTLQWFRDYTYRSGKVGAIFYQILPGVPQLSGHSSTLYEMQNTAPPCDCIDLGNRHFGMEFTKAMKDPCVYGVVRRTLGDMYRSGIFGRLSL